MNVQIVMDATGDTRHSFDATDAKSVAEAEARFQTLTEKGFRAVSLGRAGEPGVLLRSFDPAARETLFIPQLQGDDQNRASSPRAESSHRQC